MKQLLTTEQMANLLQVSTRFLWELQKKKKIPSVRFGKVIRFDAEAVLQTVKNNAK